MYDLPPRRRISLILVKLGPAHLSLQAVYKKPAMRSDLSADATDARAVAEEFNDR